MMPVHAYAYVINVYSKFGGSHKFLPDNGTDFRNQLFTKVAFTLGMIEVFSSPYPVLHITLF